MIKCYDFTSSKDEVVADVPADALAEDAPVYHMPSTEPAYYP